MDSSEVPCVRGGAGPSLGTPQAPPADWCKQLWHQFEFAIGERERELSARESQLKEGTARLEARTRALEVAQQEKWAELENSRKALDLREQKLVRREKRYCSWRLNACASQPQAGAGLESGQHSMRVLATAAVYASEPGTEGLGKVLSVYREKEDTLDMADCRPRSTDAIVLVEANTQLIEIGADVEASVLDPRRDNAAETGMKEPQELQTVGIGKPPCEPPKTDGAVAVEQDDAGQQLDEIPLSVRRKFLKGNNRRRKQPDKAEADVTAAEDQLPAPALKFARVRPKGKDTLLRSGKQDVCVEVALQEDAPGLLESLRERGLVEDLRLFGDSWRDEDLATYEDEGFADLEDVIQKIWRGSGLTTLPPTILSGQSGLRNRPYCLGCLSTLMEQSKSMNRQKWPVEWGWCRPLRAFVFVFVKHNRIVLERPEYGFATYFFELVQTISYPWQVRRLVTVMSAASCSRAALMENKPLEVGHDVTQEEAEILEGYGWSPNSGIASLLNFCDRVVHDYNKGEGDSMEWKVKIGKLLMDGYDHGSMVKAPPRRLQLTNACSIVQSMPAKVEAGS